LLIPCASSVVFASRAPKIITVQRSTVIAFCSLAGQTKIDSDSNEALDDFEYYLGKVEGTLQRRGVDLREVNAVTFQMRVGNRLSTFHPRKDQCGYLPIEPGKPPHVLYGVMTDDDLLEAASRYFSKLGK